jgi:hypothetical protein
VSARRVDANAKKEAYAKKADVGGAARRCHRDHSTLYRRVLATPSSGFTGTTIAVGRFGEFDVFNQLIQHGPHDGNVWLSLQKTKGCRTRTCRAMSGSRRTHRLAHAPWPQPDCCHGGNGNNI